MRESALNNMVYELNLEERVDSGAACLVICYLIKERRALRIRAV